MHIKHLVRVSWLMLVTWTKRVFCWVCVDLGCIISFRTINSIFVVLTEVQLLKVAIILRNSYYTANKCECRYE